MTLQTTTIVQGIMEGSSSDSSSAVAPTSVSHLPPEAASTSTAAAAATAAAVAAPSTAPIPSASTASGPQWTSLTVTMPSEEASPEGAICLPRTSHEFQESRDDIPPPKADFSAPPPYEEVTKLPTYEEVQREKTLQGEVPWPNVSVPRAPPQPLTFLTIDAESGPEDGDSAMLGTDFMFFTAFVVAFMFNWVGFLLLMCFCHTIAARYGALSGFGLSLAKWTLIVKHSKVLESRENNWLWWLIMTFGLLICIRAIVQYLNIKRGWRMLSGSAQERLMFFY